MSLRPTVYIAGPISSSGDLYSNVNKATEVFVALCHLGFAPHCPHWSVFSAEPAMNHPSGSGRLYAVGTAHGYPGIEYETWVDVGEAWAVAADAVFRLTGESNGADREVKAAEAAGKPVFYSFKDILEWKEAHRAVLQKTSG